MKSQNQTVGRLAPSPTGMLHLGNAWAFLLAYLACRLENGKLYLRMEDIDPDRSKKTFAKAIVEDLTWLGLDWDHEIVWQSERFELYEKTIAELSGLVYSCFCTRKELRDLAHAPQLEENINSTKQRFVMPDTGAFYQSRCRNLNSEQRENKVKSQKNYCLRIACPPFNLPLEKNYLMEYFRLTGLNNVNKQEFSNFFTPNFKFQDALHGEQSFSLAKCGGDFALRRSDKVYAYQLAVCCDDKAMGVNQIVRGDDILTSTPRQLYLHSLLKHKITNFAHIPLLLDEHGDRLAKRHQSQSLANLRERGIDPKGIISYFAKLIGIGGTYYNAKDLLEKMQNLGYNNFPWDSLKPYGKQSGIFVKLFDTNFI